MGDNDLEGDPGARVGDEMSEAQFRERYGDAIADAVIADWPMWAAAKKTVEARECRRRRLAQRDAAAVWAQIVSMVVSVLALVVSVVALIVAAR